VCKVGSDLLEFSDFIENPIEGVTNRYLSDNSDLVATGLIGAPTTINALEFVLDSSRSEFLLDIPDVSFSGGTYTSTPFLNIAFINKFTTTGNTSGPLRKLFSELGYTDPSAGQVVCFAVKRVDSAISNSPVLFNAYNTTLGQTSDSFGLNLMFLTNSFDFFNAKLDGEGKWATLMFTGTRWVAMGSNGWY